MTSATNDLDGHFNDQMKPFRDDFAALSSDRIIKVVAKLMKNSEEFRRPGDTHFPDQGRFIGVELILRAAADVLRERRLYDLAAIMGDLP